MKTASMRFLSRPSACTVTLVKRCACFLIGWSVFLCAGNADETTSQTTLYEAGGEQREGILQEIREDGTLIWVDSGAPNVSELDSDEVTRLTWMGAKSIPPKDTDAFVDVRNGDLFSGRVAEMNADHVVLSTHYAGTLHLPRKEIRSLKWGYGSGVLYKGPTPLDEWTRWNGLNPQTGWQFANHTLFTSAGSMEWIGKEIPDLPDRVSIEFRVNWKETVQLETSFWADRAMQPIEKYALVFRPGWVQVKRRTRDGYTRIGTIHPEGLDQAETAHIRMLLDRETKTIHLFLDDTFVHTFADVNAEESFKGGTALGFQASPLGGVLIQDVVIRTWNGRMVSKTEREKMQGSTLVLKNGDQLSGEVLAVSPTTVTILLGGQEMKIPLTRVSELMLNPEKLSEQQESETTLQLFLPGGERMSLNNFTWNDGRVKGHSSVAGEMTVDAVYIEEAGFHPDVEKTHHLHLPNSWKTP